MPSEENKQNTKEQTIGIKPEIDPVVAENPEIVENKEPKTVLSKPIASTGQLGGNEPLKETASKPEITPKIEREEVIKSNSPEELPPSATLPEEKPPAPVIQEIIKETPKITPVILEKKSLAPVIQPRKISMHELFIKAQNAIQTRKRKKLNKIMAMFLKIPNPADGQETKITNDQVEKLLHVSDSTATRYLAILKKEGKIKQNGETGKWVYYTKSVTP